MMKLFTVICIIITILFGVTAVDIKFDPSGSLVGGNLNGGMVGINVDIPISDRASIIGSAHRSGPAFHSRGRNQFTGGFRFKL